MTVIGKLVLALPDPAVPLVLIQVAFAGLIDPGEPSVLVVASIHGSQILGMPVTGDVCLLTRGGPDPTFVLSAGGFHPAFPLPRGVPPLARLGMDLSPLPLIELRSESYFAITSNTVQFGARIELVAEVAECGLRGHLGLDVLIQLDPFRFVASVSIGIALTVFGEELVGIALDLTLEGPAPWRARGRGSIDLFLFSVSFDFDEQWGTAPALPRPAPDVGRELRQAIAAPSAWVVHRSASGVPGIVVTAGRRPALGRGELVDPYGCAQRARSGGFRSGSSIDRFDRIPLPVGSPGTSSTAGSGEVPSPRPGRGARAFAAAVYLALSDDQQLSRPAYEPFRARARPGRRRGRVRPADPAHDHRRDQGGGRPGAPLGAYRARRAAGGPGAAAGGVRDIEQPLWWTAGPGHADHRRRADPADRGLGVGDGASCRSTGAGTTATELFEVIGASGRPDLMVVEAWEMGS